MQLVLLLDASPLSFLSQCGSSICHGVRVGQVRSLKVECDTLPATDLMRLVRCGRLDDGYPVWTCGVTVCDAQRVA